MEEKSQTSLVRTPEPGWGLMGPDPFAEMRRFRNMFDNMFESLFDFGAPRNAWSPAMNVYREGQDLVAELAVPGVRKEDVEVRLEGETLTLSGHTETRSEVREEDMLRREMFAGRFSRSMRLPGNVSPEQIRAECKDGILRVRMPLREPQASSKRIEIE